MRPHLFVVASLALTLACAAPPADDATDTSNYQAEYWHFGSSTDSIPEPFGRFSMGYERYTSGTLVVMVDTALDRNNLGPPYTFTRTDSVMVRGLGKTERLAPDCRAGADARDTRIVGVVRDSTRKVWTRPRLAWMIDTATAKLRGIETGSMLCSIQGEPE